MNSNENVKVTKVSYLGNKLYGFVCPKCGKILATWSKGIPAPVFALCECKVEAKPDYEIREFDTFGFPKEHIKMLVRNIEPEFSAVITDKGLQDVEWHGPVCDASVAARALREATDWLVNANCK